MACWSYEEKRILMAEGRAGSTWEKAAQRLPKRTAKACGSQWRQMATNADCIARHNALPVSSRAPLANSGKVGRPAEIVPWPRIGSGKPLEGICFLDDPAAIADKGSPEPSTRYSPRPPSPQEGAWLFVADVKEQQRGRPARWST